MSPFNLNASNINLSLESREILRDVSFSINKNSELLALMGSNGAGKSSLFRCLLGIERRYTGHFIVADEKIDSLETNARAQLGIEYLSQESWLFQDMSCLENLTAIAELICIPKIEIADRVHALMKKYHLERFAKTKAKFLSGGEKRRLEIARTMLSEPKLLILDEPFAGLDPHSSEVFQKILLEIHGKGVSIMISDHHTDRISSFAERVIFLEEGRLAFDGTMREAKESRFLSRDPLT